METNNTKTKKTASNITNKHQEPSIILNHAAGFCCHGRGIGKAKVRMKEGPYASHVTPMVTWESLQEILPPGSIIAFALT